jgi:hypothetical protein
MGAMQSLRVGFFMFFERDEDGRARAVCTLVRLVSSQFSSNPSSHRARIRRSDAGLPWPSSQGSSPEGEVRRNGKYASNTFLRKSDADEWLVQVKSDNRSIAPMRGAGFR